MPCYSPIKGWRSPDGRVTFTKSLGYGDLQATVACGRCIGCRLERSRQWAVRCVHEASLHDENCFITLTYADKHLPKGHSLVRRAMPDFIKRLRRRVQPRRLSVLYCGEYGEKLGRPHYHALLFGFDFPDKVRLPRSPSKADLFRSTMLESLWPLGQSSIGALTFESAQYVARYTVKKIYGDRAVDHYRRVDLDTGEMVELVPEFIGMSRRPAIGLRWFARFGKEVFPDDFVVSRGKKVAVPRYYERLLRRGVGNCSVDFDAIRSLRRDRFIAGVKPGERSPRRLDVKRQVKLAAINLTRKELDK